MILDTQPYPLSLTNQKALTKSKGHATKEVNSVSYRPVYIVSASALVQVHPLLRIGKNIGRTSEIQLFRLVRMFWTGTNKKKKEKEKEEEDEKNGSVTH